MTGPGSWNVVEVQDVAGVVGDVGDPAPLMGVVGLRLGVVADRDVPLVGSVTLVIQ